MMFCGVWIEKGMGLIIPGFIPLTLGEIVEYSPSLAEWQVTAGVWAVGLGVLTISVRITVRVFTAGRTRSGHMQAVADMPAPGASE